MVDRQVCVRSGVLVEAGPRPRRSVVADRRCRDPGDIVLVAGKGHETWQEVGRSTEFPSVTKLYGAVLSLEAAA